MSLFLAFLITACTSSLGLQRNASIPVKAFTLPSTNYSSLAWIGGNMIVLSWGQDISNYWSYAEDGDQNLHQIAFPIDQNCSNTAYVGPESLPDGRLEIWKLCRSETQTITYLVAYDWQTGKLDTLSGPVPLGSSQASWNPDESRAVTYLDSKFSSQTLYWIWRNGFGPMDLVITDQGKSWNLNNLYPNFPESKTIHSGNTGRADWSQDGHSIAFFASTDAIGKTDFQRFYVEYKLYLMDAAKLQPRSVLDKIYFPFIIKWSPDSKAIAFIGQYGNFKEDGIWLYSLESDSILNIAKGKYQDILWDRDGEKITAIRCDENQYCSKVEEYDLTNFMHPTQASGLRTAPFHDSSSRKDWQSLRGNLE
jgi:Eukaryotic translation initiation factor eIF2A